MNWKEFEDLFEQKLIDNNIAYKREGVIRTYGHKARQGKHDFKLEDCKINAIELKRIERLSNIGIAWPGSKKQGSIKQHQIKALRNAGSPIEAGFLFYEGKTDKCYWMDISTLDGIIIEHGMISSFGNGVLDSSQVDLDDFVSRLPI